MTLTKTASFVFSALLGSPRAGEAFAPLAMSDVSMVSTTMPSHGMSKGAIKIPTSGSTTGRGTARVTRDQVRSVSSNTAPSRFCGESENPDIQNGHHQQHPASAFYFADEATTNPHPPPAAQIPGTPAHRDQLPPPAPPEPGGSAGAGTGAFQSAYDRPWRKRARDARAGTVFENRQAFGLEGYGGEGSGGAMRQRQSEKEEVVAFRKSTQKKAMNRAVLPIVDLVGIVSPLIIIVGMSVQNVS
eukprot:g7253.t1